MFNSASRDSQLTRDDRSGTNYVSPSDEIMSPCTAKLNAFRNKQVGKYVLPTVDGPRCRTCVANLTSTQGQAKVSLRPGII